MKKPCRFCGRLYTPRGLPEAFEYCRACSDDRKRAARLKFYGTEEWVPMTPQESEQMGPYFSMDRLRQMRGQA